MGEYLDYTHSFSKVITIENIDGHCWLRLIFRRDSLVRILGLKQIKLFFYKGRNFIKKILYIFF